MSIEIEAKMKLADRDAVDRRLQEIGAEYLDAFSESNSFFDSSEGRLKSTDQGLRIRVEVRSDGHTTTTITHKGPRAHGKLKSRRETEVEVEDASDAAALLSALGYAHVMSFEKRRTRYKLDGCHIELDTLPYIGDFIEIEGPSDENVLAVREKLQLGDSPLIKNSYIGMLLAAIRERGLRVNMIRFEEEASPVS